LPSNHAVYVFDNIVVLFCHPAKYGIDKVKPHDIVLDYTGDESKPIIAQIFVAPHEKAS
jgi:hypothetical protein